MRGREREPYGARADTLTYGQSIYRLETLLEDAIDTQFDLFEIFVLRNTFTFSDDLLPYISLPHHVRHRMMMMA